MEREERLDLISNLPSEILKIIVSFIPLKEAVKTSTLSTSWKSLWTPIQVDLEFDSNEDGEKLIQLVSTFLKSCDSPQLCKFHLKREKECPTMEDEFIFLATKGAENELHVDFSKETQVTRNFNLVLSSSHLKEAGSLSSLKTLHLRSVNNFAKDLVSGLFSNFQLLESLKLEKCTGLERVDIKASDCLRSFVMVDCPKTCSITLSAPKLESFWYRGVLPLVELRSSPHLFDVVLDLREGLGRNEFDCEDVLSLLACLQDIEILTISGWLLEWLCMAGVIFGRLQFKFNKLKELHWISTSIDQRKRDSLVCFLNISPCLEKLFVNIDQNSSFIYCPFFHQYWHEPHLWIDYATVKSKASQLNHLNAVKLVGFTEKKDELLLMDLLIEKAFTIKSMIVTSPENQSWRVEKIPCSQLMQTSRCYPKHIGISFPSKDYFFGLIEEDNSSFCPSNGWFL